MEDIWPDVLKRREPAWLRPSVIPGLLQTPEYASLVLSSGLLDADEVAGYVETRPRRQAAVLNRRKPPLFIAVIDECALLRGEPDVMHPQLDHLIEMAQRPTTFLHVLPLDACMPGRPGRSSLRPLRMATWGTSTTRHPAG
ncbi:Scr1 family TA system antitoxin-like transcriptional regulator [Micromonospora sp. WMMD736]|uniref:Scr1 family TA system antitoxin-like transcriptional regulator n=1 Tax=Micromonospora sp. WMMD736 TaxID=3404112 RepID=UPI003B960AED